MNKEQVPGPVVIVARELVEALDRHERSKARLAEAQQNLQAAERIVRGSRERFLGTLEAYGLDDNGDAPAAARAIWNAAIAKATGSAA